MRKILVTGALGQIGAELVPALRARYGAAQVVASGLRMRPGAPDAEAEIHIALGEQPGWPNYRDKLAEIYQLQGRMDDALSELNAGIEAQPDYNGYYLSRGKVYLKSNKADLADRDFKMLCRSTKRFAHSGLKRIGKFQEVCGGD